MLDRCSGAGGGSTLDEALTRIQRARGESHDEHFVSCARLLNIHEANYAAFKKAVGNMFSIMAGQTASFTVSVDTDRSKFSVAAEIDSLHVYRDLLLLSKAGLPDDRITAFGHPLKDIKMKQVYPRKYFSSLSFTLFAGWHAILNPPLLFCTSLPAGRRLWFAPAMRSQASSVCPSPNSPHAHGLRWRLSLFLIPRDCSMLHWRSNSFASTRI